MDSPDGAATFSPASFLSNLPPPGDTDFIHAGFQDCAEEAIQYLVNVENVSMEDPVIMGLRQHLAKKRLGLDCENVVENEPVRTNEADMCMYLSNNVHPHAQVENLSQEDPDSGLDEVDGPLYVQNDSDSSKADSAGQLDSEDAEQDLKLLEQLPNLTMLAQSNPAIAHLAGEILSLIDQEEDDTTE